MRWAGTGLKGKEGRTMKLLEYKILIVILISLGLIAFLMGCASTRYIKSPSTTAPECRISGSNSDLDINVNWIIRPDGPGSWVKGALWDEYVVTISTPPDKSLTIYNVALIDPTGIQRARGANPLELITASRTLSKVYEGVDITTGASLAGMIASCAIPIPFIGTAFSLAGMAASESISYASAKDQDNINEEFTKRSLPHPISLSSNAHAKGSIFFPIVPNPKAIFFEYRVGQDMKTLEIPLEMIQSQPN